MPALARLMGIETLGTFHERQGDQSLLTKNGPVPIGWGRAFGERTEYRRDGILSPEFDGHLWGFQAGFDLAAMETWAGRDHGAFIGNSEANGDVRGFALGQRRAASGSVDLDATSLGLYWTHIGPGGWYLDSVLMHSWLDGLDLRSSDRQHHQSARARSVPGDPGRPLRRRSPGRVSPRRRSGRRCRNIPGASEPGL